MALLQNWHFLPLMAKELRKSSKWAFHLSDVQWSLFKYSRLDNSTPCTEVSRSRTQLQREPSTFGSKNVIWLHSLDKQKSDLTRWTNNRDERQTTDLWVTPTDKGSASLGRNMNALHINKILVALTQKMSIIDALHLNKISNCPCLLWFSTLYALGSQDI